MRREDRQRANGVLQCGIRYSGKVWVWSGGAHGKIAELSQTSQTKNIQLLVRHVSEYGDLYGGVRGRGGEAHEKVEVVCFGTYNIQNGHNGGLKLALRGMD